MLSAKYWRDGHSSSSRGSSSNSSSAVTRTVAAPAIEVLSEQLVAVILIPLVPLTLR
jgi:hypothetical protein